MNAESVNTWANYILIASLVVGVVSTYFIVKSSNEKERKLKLELSRANADAEKAKAEAAEANKKTKELEQLNLTLEGDVAKLQIKAANAQRALLEVQDRIRPRHLTDEQAAYLADTLKNKSPGDVWLECKSGDEEARSFGEQIFKILRHANWPIINNTLHDIAVYNANAASKVGIIISVKDLKDVPPGIVSFYKAILNFGFSIRLEESSKSGIVIWIGAKP